MRWGCVGKWFIQTCQISSQRKEFAPFWSDGWLTSPACAGSRPWPYGISVTGIIEMPADSVHVEESGPDKWFKLDVLDAALEILEEQQKKLDSAGFSMASIHLNDAIERLRSERVCLMNELKP